MRSNRSTSKLAKRDRLPDLGGIPSPLSQTWTEEPSEELRAACVTMLAIEVQPNVADDQLRMAALKRRLRKRGYTRGELLYATDRLADDPELDDKIRYGGTLSGADFRRVIEPCRQVRRKIVQAHTRRGGDFPEKRQYRELTEQEMREAVDLIPELDVEDFGDRPGQRDNQTLYILKADARERLEGQPS